MSFELFLLLDVLLTLLSIQQDFMSGYIVYIIRARGLKEYLFPFKDGSHFFK